MRHKGFLSVLLPILASALTLALMPSCKFRPENLWEIPSSPGDSFALAPYSCDGDFSFIVISDMHIGRGGKTFVPEAATLKPWIQALKPAFILNLGDATDQGKPSEFRAVGRYFDSLELGDIKVFAMVGNHEIKEDFASSWESCWPGQPYYQAFRWGDVSFYLANNALRTLGRKQLAELEAALAKDYGSRKILVCHVPLHSPDAYAYFNMADAKEVNRILGCCFGNGVDLVISGHCHRDSEFRYNSALVEKIVGSYNGSPSAFETPPMFYNFKYSQAGMRITMETYVYDSQTGKWGLKGETKDYRIQ